jgi:hypothetical protein
LRPDRNPLRRTADRIEAAVMAALLVLLVAGAPLAAWAFAGSAAAGGARTERAQASWRHVPAVLLQDAPRPAHARFQASLEPMVRARWTAPDGAPRTGEVYAPGGTPAGKTVLVWTDSSGRPTETPLQPVDVATRVALAASLAAGLVAGAAAGAGLLTRWLLDRRRLAAWDVGWSQTGPQWTTRR